MFSTNKYHNYNYTSKNMVKSIVPNGTKTISSYFTIFGSDLYVFSKAARFA